MYCSGYKKFYDLCGTSRAGTPRWDFNRKELGLGGLGFKHSFFKQQCQIKICGPSKKKIRPLCGLF